MPSAEPAGLGASIEVDVAPASAQDLRTDEAAKAVDTDRWVREQDAKPRRHIAPPTRTTSMDRLPTR